MSNDLLGGRNWSENFEDVVQFWTTSYGFESPFSNRLHKDENAVPDISHHIQFFIVGAYSILHYSSRFIALYRNNCAVFMDEYYFIAIFLSRLNLN